ncbi:hypothetical protein H4582DRAFT_2007277 [Lactarius indigo]|nr:hypothetical protein H4582DRAFT_2007277 [Lactarius indigo]
MLSGQFTLALSLVINISCALLTTLLQQPARRYRRHRQARACGLRSIPGCDMGASASTWAAISIFSASKTSRSSLIGCRVGHQSVSTSRHLHDM